jgi:hypothetical protein
MYWKRLTESLKLIPLLVSMLDNFIDIFNAADKTYPLLAVCKVLPHLHLQV